MKDTVQGQGTMKETQKTKTEYLEFSDLATGKYFKTLAIGAEVEGKPTSRFVFYMRFFRDFEMQKATEELAKYFREAYSDGDELPEGAGWPAFVSCAYVEVACVERSLEEEVAEENTITSFLFRTFVPLENAEAVAALVNLDVDNQESVQQHWELLLRHQATLREADESNGRMIVQLLDKLFKQSVNDFLTAADPEGKDEYAEARAELEECGMEAVHIAPSSESLQ